MKTKKINIFLVDDDPVFLQSLEIDFLLDEHFSAETYPTGELCIKNLSRNPDLIVLDYHLDGVHGGAMNGMETLDKIKAFNPHIPVVMLSSWDKVEVAVNCMHHKAFDYVVKSETAFIRIQKIITGIFGYYKIYRE